jgi:hypothetical protein
MTTVTVRLRPRPSPTSAARSRVEWLILFTVNADMNGWSEVAHQDPWGPSHDKSGWQPTGNTGWGRHPYSRGWMDGVGTFGFKQGWRWCVGGRHKYWSLGHQAWEVRPGNAEASGTGWGHGHGHQTWDRGQEEEEEEEEEGDGDSGWGEGGQHWTAALRDGGGHHSHWTKWGRTEGWPPPPIPASAIKKSHSTPQPSTKPYSAQKHPYQDHAEALNRLLSSSTHRPTPSISRDLLPPGPSQNPTHTRLHGPNGLILGPLRL